MALFKISDIDYSLGVPDSLWIRLLFSFIAVVFDGVGLPHRGHGRCVCPATARRLLAEMFAICPRDTNRRACKCLTSLRVKLVLSRFVSLVSCAVPGRVQGARKRGRDVDWVNTRSYYRIELANTAVSITA